jgi:hypothetical protein
VQDFVEEYGEVIIGNNQVSFKRPDQFIGQTAKRAQSNTPYQMIIGWVGMPPGKDWIRIDITRHLEVIPRMMLRDLISTKKAQSDPKTVELVQHIAEVDSRPLSNTIQRHETAMAAHADVQQGNTPALSNRNVRAKGSSSWLGKIMGPLLNIGGTVAQTLGGTWGKVIGTGMQFLGSRLNQTDNMAGGVTQGLATRGLY